MPILETVEEMAAFLEQNDEWRRRLFAILIPRSLQRMPDELDEFREETRAEFKAIRQEMREGFERIDREFENVRQEMREEIASVRQEMREEFANVRREMREGFERVDREFENVRQEMRQEFANVRQEMREEIASVRQEMREEIASVRQEMREEIASVRQEMREGFERVDRELERLGTQTKKNTDDIAELKGISLEQKYRDQARSWFSKYLRKARVVDLMDLEELLPENQSFTEQDREELSGTDLFLIGLDKRDGRECVYVVEISWVVDASDVERAARRAQILSQYGLLTAAMSAGRELTEGARDLAQQLGCGLLVGTRFEAEPALLA